MLRLFKAFIFRLRRDLTFRITLFIGIGLAIFMTALYLILEYSLNLEVGESGIKIKMLTGQGMLISSLSPAQNFGIAIPVNLISFTIIEFMHGTIRNKIIAGNSKGKIYASLFLSGLIFSIVLMTVYASLCTLLGTIFGGFHPTEGINPSAILSGGGNARVSTQYIVRIIIVSLTSYVSITSFAVFIATLTRQIGGAIPIVIIGILFCYLFATIVATSSLLSDNLDTLVTATRIFDPLYAQNEQFFEVVNAETGEMIQKMKDETFIAAIINNLVYATLFFLAGFFIFKKRDVK